MPAGVKEKRRKTTLLALIIGGEALFLPAFCNGQDLPPDTFGSFRNEQY